MARMLRCLLLLTMVLATGVVVVSAEGWLPFSAQKSNQDKAKAAADQTVGGAKSWTNWASQNIPFFSSDAAKQTSDKLDASKDKAKYTASNTADEGEKNARTAAETAREYAAKGLERMTSTKDQLHGATKGFIQRWGSWAKDNVGKYYSYGPVTEKATDTATDVVDNAASNVDSAADSANQNVDTAKEEVIRKSDEKEL